MTKNKQDVAQRDAARGYTDADVAEVMDHPEATDAQLAAAQPFAKAFPEQAAALRRARGPK